MVLLESYAFSCDVIISWKEVSQAMFIDSFNYDGKNATVVKKEERQNDKGNTVVRLTLDNGVIFVYTAGQNGFERLDTNFVLVRQENGYYYSDLNTLKEDFNDYY